MKGPILLFALISLFIGCSPKVPNTDPEIEILNDIFLELVGTEYYYKKLPPPPMPLEYAENKQDSINYYINKEKYDSAFDGPKLDKSTLVIGMDPFPNNPKRVFRDWDIQDTVFLRSHYTDSIHSKDFDQLLSRLVDSTDFKNKKLVLSQLKYTGRYVLKDLGKLDEQKTAYWKSEKFRYIASIKFSDIKINTQHNKAVFYLDFLCGKLCGSGEIIFCQKIATRWQIVDRYLIWVS